MPKQQIRAVTRIHNGSGDCRCQKRHTDRFADHLGMQIDRSRESVHHADRRN
jgi:hypothetical protein